LLQALLSPMIGTLETLETIRQKIASLPYRIEGSGDYFVVRKGFLIGATVGRLPSGQLTVEGTFGSTFEAILALLITLAGLIVIPRLVFAFVIFPKQRQLAAEVRAAIAQHT
jgi:hypothetical protein